MASGKINAINFPTAQVNYVDVTADTFLDGINQTTLNAGLYLISISVQPRINPPEGGMSVFIATAIGNDVYTNGDYQNAWTFMGSGWKVGNVIIPIKITSDNTVVKWRCLCSVTCEIRFSTTPIKLQ